MTNTFPSQSEWSKTKKVYNSLPQDDYLLQVFELKKETRPKYKSQEMEDVVNITLQVVSLKDGTTATDKEGKDATNRKIFFTARPNNFGFKDKGTVPSSTRQFVAYITNQDVFGEITYGDWADFEGNKINAEIIEYVGEDGSRKNKVSRFLPMRKKVAPQTPTDSIPVIGIEDNAMPKEVKFNEDKESIDVSQIPF
ncbi:MAG TPA: hypothetical protein VI795_02355 [Patescibacteria group bacterium]|nr:hypothetical protein [Patescibacteria group bacterium]